MIKKGQTFTLGGTRYKVAYVNQSRAHCVATDTRHVTVTDAKGETRTFTAASSRSIDISPDTPLDLLSELRLA